jgi:hypothetical protein
MVWHLHEFAIVPKMASVIERYFFTIQIIYAGFVTQSCS